MRNEGSGWRVKKSLWQGEYSEDREEEEEEEKQRISRSKNQLRRNWRDQSKVVVWQNRRAHNWRGMETGRVWIWYGLYGTSYWPGIMGRGWEEEATICPPVMKGRGETGEITQGWKRGQNVHTSVDPQSLNQSLILQNVTIPLLSANIQNQLANTDQAGLHRKWQLITQSVKVAEVCGLYLGLPTLPLITCRGHHGATYTEADGDS